MPCSASSASSLPTSVTRRPFIVWRVATGRSAVGGAAHLRGDAAQSMPGAFGVVQLDLDDARVDLHLAVHAILHGSR